MLRYSTLLALPTLALAHEGHEHSMKSMIESTAAELCAQPAYALGAVALAALAYASVRLVRRYCARRAQAT